MSKLCFDDGKRVDGLKSLNYSYDGNKHHSTITTASGIDVKDEINHRNGNPMLYSKTRQTLTITPGKVDVWG
jgi:hypothetical protein